MLCGNETLGEPLNTTYLKTNESLANRSIEYECECNNALVFTEYRDAKSYEIPKNNTN